MGVILTDETFERIMKAVEGVERNTISTEGIGGDSGYINDFETILVKLTVNIADGLKWEAKEVYLNTSGVAVDVTDGLTFDSSNPVFTTSVAAVDDVLEIKLDYRDDGAADNRYWIGATGGGATFIYGINDSDETGDDVNLITGTANKALGPTGTLPFPEVPLNWTAERAKSGTVKAGRILRLVNVGGTLYAVNIETT